MYSNSGFSVLSWALMAAANVTSTYADLILRDIFEPLDLGSAFNVTAENAQRMAVASTLPDTAVSPCI